MTEIILKVTDQHLRAIVQPLIASGGENENRITVQFEGHEWDGYVSLVAFNTDLDPDTIYTQNLDANNQCIVPWEVTEKACTLWVAVAGTASSDVKRTTEVCAIEIVNGAGNGNAIPAPPTPTVYDNLIALINTKQDLLVSGTNIKTINGNSLLGSGNISISPQGIYPCTTASTFSDIYSAYYTSNLLPVFDDGNGYKYYPVDIVQSSPTVIQFASVREDSGGVQIYVEYVDTSNTWTGYSLGYVQEKLVSGTNIKTINNTSLLGSGDISITGTSDLFECTYGTTTYAQITQALSDGKLPYVKASSSYRLYSFTDSTYIWFITINGTNSISYARITSSSTWSSGTWFFERTSNKVTSISSSSTDTQYPSAKCVYDNLQLITNTTYTCIYGTTTYAEIQAAIQSGKDPVVFDTLSNEVFHFAGYGSNEVNFAYVKAYASGNPQLSVEYVTINMSTSSWNRQTPFVIIP